MAIALGTENKRQVRLVIGLFVVIALVAGWEIYSTFFASSNPHAAVRPVLAAARTTSPARKVSRSRLDPVLRIDELNRTEQLEYTGNGRDVFSAIFPPVVVEAPVASARPSDIAAAVPPVVEPPKPPSMDLKYLGFAQTKDKTYTALFTHGDDMFAAKTGDIMFHRFRVGVIQPSSVQVTDLTHNITQSIAVAAPASN
jgi:hypothetical protein